jgi:hypothetical protein
LKRLTLIFLFISSIGVRGQASYDGLIGVYKSTGDKFEKYSTLTLEKENRFIYKYGAGGCQGEVMGTWTIENKRLKLTNDKVFLNNETIVYPNLSLTTWTIKKTGVKPDKLIDSGCVKDNHLHKKVKMK